MRKIFSKAVLLFLLLSVSLCISFVAAGCGNGNSSSDKGTPQNGDPTYTITFQTGAGGPTVAPIESKAGAQITAPSPKRDGYRFDGWTLNGEPYVISAMPEQNLTLVAAWTMLYTVTFITGANDITALYAPGEAIELPTVSRDGYKFIEWKLNGQTYVAGEMPSRDITVSAAWERTFTIAFNTGSDEYKVAPITDVAGAQIQAPTVNRFGYHLEYWTLNGSRYEFSVMPNNNVTLVAKWTVLTNLPAMFIDLTDADGNAIPLTSITRDAYVDSTITITNTDDEYALEPVKAEFKGRGHGSWDNEEKKCYKIKFNKKQSLFGRTKNKHWVLIACANFDDVTMSRNYLAYNMANEVFDNIEYTTPAYWLDMYVNGEYRGVYLLCEHLRVAEGRLDIQSDYGVEDTGYLVEYDSYAAQEGEEGVDYFRVEGVKYPFTVHSPDPEDYATDGNISKEEYKAQVAYIKDYITRVYNAAYGKDYDAFAELVDTDSFVDMYILHELFKNADTGWSSFYLYKKAGGKLYAGPAWDFDGTTNFDKYTDRGDRTPQGIYVAGEGQVPGNYASELYINLYKTSGFRNAVKARWKVISSNIRAFLDEKLNDDVYQTNKTAMGKNFVLWKNKDQAKAEEDWINDVKRLKEWLVKRIDYLDTAWK